jgi:DNA polymerase-1
VDGYALIYRAFFALLSRPLRTARGENTSAAWGVVNFVQRMLGQHHPDYVAWVHDAGSSFRKEVYPAYKATREKLNEELQADFDQGLQRIREVLQAFGVPVIAEDGYEADDVIGTLARQATAEGVNVVIVSGDKDFQQLVRPGVWLLNPGRGGPASVEESWVGVENGAERLGVPPHLVTDYLALLGDSSDNVPGVPGVGEKTAQELVAAYGNLDGILAHAAEVQKKRPREALLAFGDQARLSKALVTIREDVPVVLDVERLKRRTPDTTRLRQLFVELEFTSLLRSLEAAGNDAGPTAPVAVPTPVDVRILSTPGEVDALVAHIEAAGACTLQVEGMGRAPEMANAVLWQQPCGLTLVDPAGAVAYLPLRHRPWHPPQGDLLGGASGTSAGPGGTSLTARALANGAPAVANLPSLGDPSMARLRAMLESPMVQKTGHHLKGASILLRQDGVTLRGLALDTMLASYVLDPGRRAHTLDVLALEFLDRPLPSVEDLRGKGKGELGFEYVPVGVAATFVGTWARAAHDVAARLAPDLARGSAAALLRDVELPLVDVLAEMEWVGVAIDVAWLRSLKTRFQAERERVESEIHAAAGEVFNVNSNPQLRAILFEKLQLPVKKKTVTGPSTDASVLQELADEGHLLPALLMEYREVAKLESTYLDTLPNLVLPRDGRLHTSFNQTVAATGRLSSSDPNLQNIPVRRELGRDIRRGFVPSPGWRLVAADYSQVELRLLAHLSHDPAFVDAFSRGVDIHRQTASIIFGVDAADVTSEMRARAKTINFATIYGQGAHALSRQLKISNAEAKAFIATYFERFRGVREYLDGMVAFAKANGYVETIFQRRRYIPELKEKNFNMRAFGERVATNAPIQGSAADLIKVAMIRIHARLQKEGLATRMLLQVHDELVFEAPADEVATILPLVKAEMEGAAVLSVPLEVDLGVGENWVDAKH